MLWELEERVAQAGAQARPGPQRPPTAGRAGKAIGQEASDPRRRRVLARCTLQRPIGRRKGGRSGGLGVAQVPEHATTDKGRERDLVRKTATVLRVGQAIRGQGQPTPGAPRH